MTQIPATVWARETGELDNEDGVDRSPVASEALRGLHLQLSIEFGTDPELLKAWLEGWDRANVAGTIPEDNEELYHDGSNWRHCWHGYRRGECPTCNRYEEA